MEELKTKQNNFFVPTSIIKHPEKIKTTTEIIHGDFTEICKDFADNSIDCIITDPPYDKPSLHLYSDLAKLASRILKPGGFCVVYAGKMYLKTIRNSLSKHLNYIWDYISIQL